LPTDELKKLTNWDYNRSVHILMPLKNIFLLISKKENVPSGHYIDNLKLFLNAMQFSINRQEDAQHTLSTHLFFTNYIKQFDDQFLIEQIGEKYCSCDDGTVQNIQIIPPPMEMLPILPRRPTDIELFGDEKRAYSSNNYTTLIKFEIEPHWKNGTTFRMRTCNTTYCLQNGLSHDDQPYAEYTRTVWIERCATGMLKYCYPAYPYPIF
ncbi:unnamed protein product, partial [Didymodactylos carnosus]